MPALGLASAAQSPVGIIQGNNTGAHSHALRKGKGKKPCDKTKSVLGQICGISNGLVGARNVKWLTRITVSGRESDSHWTTKDYRMLSPATDWDNIDYTKAPAIQEGPVQSAICTPLEGEGVAREEGSVDVKGYAWSGGGRGIIRVDVTVDGGETWHAAEMQQDEQQDLEHMYSWTLWEIRVPLPKDKKINELTIICKATDRSYNTQPESAKGLWNIRGLLNNSWHAVNVNIKDE